MIRLLILFLLNLSILTNTEAQLNPIVDSIPMSDGKKLAADIYIPSGTVKGPVILIQTPYNRILYRFAGLPLQIGMALNSSPYIFVIADWRGFYGSAKSAYIGSPSGGVDGYNTVEWIAAQNWSDGKIGTWGPSALGKIQFQTAKENPPHLVCICPLVAAPQSEYEEYFPNGCLRTEYVEQLDGLGYGISKVLMAHPYYDGTWTIAESINNYPESIRVPCFMIGGWYDHNVEFMLPFFTGIRAKSPLNVKDKHRLLMGPWVHGGRGNARVGTSIQGELNYPNAENRNDSLALLFFNFHLRNISNNWDATPIVQYYQMGENTWLQSNAWPPGSAGNINFYLHADGVLNNTAPVKNRDSLSFSYNPLNPSPTVGGPILRNDLDQGPYDLAGKVENRNDILIFTSNAFDQNVVMKGNANIHLKISSDKTDTDFDVRLTDVYPDGRSMLVNDGVMRMRFRNGNTQALTAPMVPGTVYDCNITLPNTAITFLKGHKIRLDITSSNYPRFNRNMNTGSTMYPGNSLDSLVNPVTAKNSVYTNSVNTSYISLPLVGYVNTGHIHVNREEGMAINPNPAADRMNVSFPENIGNDFELIILNGLGEEVLRRELTNTRSLSLDVSQFQAGVYFVQARSMEKYMIRKLVICR